MAAEHIELMGMSIDSLTEEEAISTVLAGLAAGRGGWVITPNLDHLRHFHRAPELRSMFSQADLVLADGMPLVWASRVQNTPLPERVAGSDLIGSLTKAASRRGRSVFFLGGNPGAAELAADRLCEENPRLRVAGTCGPRLGFESEDRPDRRRDRGGEPRHRLRRSRVPEAGGLIAQIREQFPTTWFLGVGVSLSFVGGDIARAPGWMRSSGLEWLHRLATEPRRLFARYVVHGMPFALSLMSRSALTRLLASRRAPRQKTLAT